MNNLTNCLKMESAKPREKIVVTIDDEDSEQIGMWSQNFLHFPILDIRSQIAEYQKTARKPAGDGELSLLIASSQIP